MSQKMQKLLDYIVNEEMDKANELFHEIVVEKSREIYENLIVQEMDDELDEEESEENTDESVDEAFGDDDETTSVIGGDPSDDMMDKVADTDAPSDTIGAEGDDDVPADKGDIKDLESAIAELRAEFESLVGNLDGEEDDEEEMPGDAEMPADDEQAPADDEEADDDEADDEEADDDEEKAYENLRMGVREYRETVGNDWHKNSMKSPGPVGSGKGDLAGQATETNSKSVVASGKGKPTTGATPHNIAQAHTGDGTNTGTSPNGKTGGLVGGVKGQFTKGVEKNISSSASAGMKDGAALSKQGSGYPGNNKSPGPVGSGTGDKAGQTSVGQVKSPLNGAPGRAA